MAKSTNNKQAWGLISYWTKKWESRYKQRPNLNKFREQWRFDKLLEDMPYEMATEVIDYYFDIMKWGHSIQDFFYSYNDLLERKRRDDEDRERAAELRQRTLERIRKAKNGEQ